MSTFSSRDLRWPSGITNWILEPVLSKTNAGCRWPSASSMISVSELKTRTT